MRGRPAAPAKFEEREKDDLAMLVGVWLICADWLASVGKCERE